jgi:hypothetical protein
VFGDALQPLLFASHLYDEGSVSNYMEGSLFAGSAVNIVITVEIIRLSYAECRISRYAGELNCSVRTELA